MRCHAVLTRAFLASAFAILAPGVSFALTPAELRGAIDQKAAELSQVQTQINKVQDDLVETGKQKTTLKTELNSIDYSINQLNLGIRSSEITIQKARLEIEAIGYDIGAAETKIGERKRGMRETLQSIYENDGDSMLVLLLKHKSLAAGVLAAQSLQNLNEGLSIELAQYEQLSDDLNAKLDAVSTRKTQIETEQRNLVNRKGIVKDQKEDRQSLLAATQNKERIYQQQLDDLQKRQEEISAEIGEIEEQLRLKIDPSLLPVPRPGVLAWPTVGGRVSQHFGDTPFSRTGIYRGAPHNGLDIAAPIGTPILAAEAGKVVAIGNTDTYCPRGSYGRFIVVEHENNLTTLYAHLSRAAVAVGDQVSRGAIIGYMGRTGLATGSHLHFTVYAASTYYVGPSRVCGSQPYGGSIDPEKYL